MKKIITTDLAPKAIGPYSQGVSVGPFAFFSGQIPLDPKTGEMVGETVEDQTVQVLKNIEGMLAAVNADFSKIVKTTIFLTTMNDFAKVNEIYSQKFKVDPPARSTVAVAGLPRGAKVEIEVIVHLS